MRYKLYNYGPSGNCYKARLLLSHLEIEYESVPVDIFAGETMTPEHAARNPALTTPVLELPDGTHLPESGAILLHLAEGTELLPDDPVERAQVYRWLFFEQSAILPTVADIRFRMLTGRLDPESDAGRRASQLASAVTSVVEGHLKDRSFAVAERFTLADLALFGYLHVAHEAGVEMSGFPGIAGWLERVRAQPRHVEDLEPYPENS
ncbi:MAG TPA: glutathione S-transferase family protein, partial [Solirubrobacteraceae bacterium]